MAKNENKTEIKPIKIEKVESQLIETEAPKGEGINLDPNILQQSGLPLGINSVRVHQGKLYFIKDNRLIEKNKLGQEGELFNFNTISSTVPVSIVDFYNDKPLVIAIGRVYLVQDTNLVLLAE